jgi:hypothetical protein
MTFENRKEEAINAWLKKNGLEGEMSSKNGKVLFLDIETAPTDDDKIIEELSASIVVPGNYKKEESINAWLAENGQAELEKKIRQTALDGLYGQITSIAWAYGGGDINVLTRKSLPQHTPPHKGIGSEKWLLSGFFIAAHQFELEHGPHTVVCGHNISFDLRFLWQRAVMHGIPPLIRLHQNAKPWSPYIFDTMVEWAGASSSYSGKKSLAAIAKQVLGEEKIGEDPIQLWHDGDFDTLAVYNRRDVELVRELYKCFTFE